MQRDLESILVTRETPLRAAVERIDAFGVGAALVVDGERRLVGMLTDGDVRRAALAELDLDLDVGHLLDHKEAAWATPVTAPIGTPPDELLRLMMSSTLRQIPLLDEEGRVVDLAVLDDLVKGYELPLRAVVMAGGRGTRLLPLTEEIPKPMLPVRGRPLLEHIVDRLRATGIRRVSVTTHFRRERISDHFGNGDSFGVEIDYVHEDAPLGTAGALSRLRASPEPLLVVNGDILTRVDFHALLQFHREHDADLTVGVRPYEVAVPFGVVETAGVDVSAIVEKPTFRRLVNAGIYLVEPSACGLVPDEGPYDMIDLIESLLAADRRVVAFPIREDWTDIGRLEDYERVNGGPDSRRENTAGTASERARNAKK